MRARQIAVAPEFVAESLAVTDVQIRALEPRLAVQLHQEVAHPLACAHHDAEGVLVGNRRR